MSSNRPRSKTRPVNAPHEIWVTADDGGGQWHEVRVVRFLGRDEARCQVAYRIDKRRDTRFGDYDLMVIRSSTLSRPFNVVDGRLRKLDEREMKEHLLRHRWRTF